MKGPRIVIISAGAIAVILLIAIGLALSSPVQTWAARRALSQRPDLNATLGSVSAGWQRVEVRALRLESNGVVLTLPALDAELPLVSAGLSDRVQIKRLVAKGWILDLTQVAKTGAGGARWSEFLQRDAAPRLREFSLLPTAYAAAGVEATIAPLFRGVFAELRLPVDLSLDGVDLEGELLVPGLNGQGVERLQLTLRGGGLRAGRAGEFALKVAGAKSDGGALTVQSDLTAEMDTPRSFVRLDLRANASASGPQFPEGVTLKVDSSAVRTATGETYKMLLLGGGNKSLADLKAEFVSADSRISGTWALDVHDTDLAPFALGRRLPTFAAAGQGGFETGTTLKELHARGRLDASASGLEALREELAAIGAVSLVADFDVLQHGNSLRVERLDAQLSGVSPVGTVRALQPFEFDLGNGELHVADPAQDLVGVSLTGLPVAWARAFTGELELTGGDIHGEFAASARDGGLALRARTPLTVNGIALSQAGDPLLRGLDLTLDASADYTPRGWQAQVVELKIQSQGGTLLLLNAKAGQLLGEGQGIKATGRWSADLPAWVAQPLAQGEFRLSAGSASGDFATSLDGTKAFEAKMALVNLVAETGEKLPIVTAEVRADITAEGKVTFNAPMLFQQGGRESDLLLVGTLTPGAVGSTIDGKLLSESLVVEDVQLLGLLLAADTAPAERKEEPDTEPFWKDLDGQITLSLKRMIYGGTFEVSDVGGTLRLESSSLKLENVRAVFGPESDLKLGGGLQFDAKAAEPYVLAADLVVTNFDTRPAFQALNSAKLPTIEAEVNLTSRISGSGGNLLEVAERSRGDVQVTAKSGIFRALSADMSNQVQKTQSTVAAIGGLIGAVTGKKEYADYANKTQILSDIAKALSEIPFDQLNVTATRAANLDIVLKDFTLIAPEVRLTGTGAIQYVEGLSILGQPLRVRLNLGARGQLGELLKRAGLLEATEDNLGYTAFAVPLSISGSLANTDASELRNALLNSALERSGLLDSILGK